MYQSNSPQASAMRICITQSDIFHHTIFPRACHPRLTSRVVWVLQIHPHSRSNRGSSNASLLMPRAAGRNLEAMVSKTSLSPPLLPERLEQSLTRSNFLRPRRSHGRPTAMRAFESLWSMPTNYSQHTCPLDTHTWTFSPSLSC